MGTKEKILQLVIRILEIILEIVKYCYLIYKNR